MEQCKLTDILDLGEYQSRIVPDPLETCCSEIECCMYTHMKELGEGHEKYNELKSGCSELCHWGAYKVGYWAELTGKEISARDADILKSAETVYDYMKILQQIGGRVLRKPGGPPEWPFRRTNPTVLSAP